MRLVIIESPFAARTWWGRWRNRCYARRAMRHALLAGDAPFASHLLYTQRGVLRDQVAAERELGIAAGLAWGERAVASLVYIDRGISAGMRHGIEAAIGCGRAVEFRSLNKIDLATRQNIARAMDECGLFPSGDGIARPGPAPYHAGDALAWHTAVVTPGREAVFTAGRDALRRRAL